MGPGGGDLWEGEKLIEPSYLGKSLGGGGFFGEAQMFIFWGVLCVCVGNFFVIGVKLGILSLRRGLFGFHILLGWGGWSPEE